MSGFDDIGLDPAIGTGTVTESGGWSGQNITASVGHALKMVCLGLLPEDNTISFLFGLILGLLLCRFYYCCSAAADRHERDKIGKAEQGTPEVDDPGSLAGKKHEAEAVSTPACCPVVLIHDPEIVIR